MSEHAQIRYLIALVVLCGALWGASAWRAALAQNPPVTVPSTMSGVPRPSPAFVPPPPAASTGAVVRCEPVTIPSYPFQSYLYQSHNCYFNMAFKRLNWRGYEATAHDLSRTVFNGIIMENEYLQLTVLPELGGRIYKGVFKPTGHNQFYQNPVLKPTRWGPLEQNWWLAAGGMEWCLPVDEHGYETAVPWQFGINQSAVGVTVTVRDTETDERLRASIDIHLPTDKAYFAISPHLENPTTSTLAYKFWLNAMLAPGGTNAPSAQLQFILPTTAMTVHSRDWRWTGLPEPGEGFAWPFQGERDLSFLGNWPYYLGCFERPAALGQFAGVYDHEVEEGMVRVYPSDVARGTKIFAAGYGPDALKPALWTDGASSYVELHGGPAPTFDDQITLDPGQTLSWTEYWYPVANIGGFVYANREAALNLKNTFQGTFIGLATTAAHNQGIVTLRRRADHMTLFQETIPTVSPARPYRAGPLRTGNLALDELSLSYTDATGRVLAEF